MQKNKLFVMVEFKRLLVNLGQPTMKADPLAKLQQTYTEQEPIWNGCLVINIKAVTNNRKNKVC